MAGDPYYRYSSLERAGSYVPGYLSPEGPTLSSHRLWNSDNSRTTSSEFFRNDLLQPRPGGYTLDGHAGVGSQTVPGYVGLSSGPIARGYSPLEDPALLRREAALGIKPSLTDIERPEPFRKSEGLLVDESNILFVDGLPRDCTRREVAHLFRPFIGFKEIRVIHKEPRQSICISPCKIVRGSWWRAFSPTLRLMLKDTKCPEKIKKLSSRSYWFSHCLLICVASSCRAGEKGHVICFVEFDDAKCALTALQALQDYKFDDKKPDAPVLKIQFAKFPFRLPPMDQRSDYTINQDSTRRISQH